MADSLKVAIAQINPIVGAFTENSQKILTDYARACEAGARILMTPELGICGYPPHDLMERPEIFERNEKALVELTQATQGKKTALVVGHVARNDSTIGRSARNQLSVLEDGKVVFTQSKTLLPTYDVFDEARYFEPAAENQVWNCDGIRVAIAICEDLWGADPQFGRRLYGRDPILGFEGQADLVLSISASPYEWKKRLRREELHAAIAKKLNAPLIYVNQVGATDEILFDGGSFAVGADGRLVGRLPLFESDFAVVETGISNGGRTCFSEDRISVSEPDEMEVLRLGLVTGIRDYFVRTGFKTALVGLSGGIDSAVVATLAAQALGPKNVMGIAMPAQYSSPGSISDAEALAKNLGIPFEVRPIKFWFATIARELGEPRGKLSDLALENLQARLRGNVLMTLANHYSALVLTTGNKSELATGYCTQYGDMAGAIAPIGDLFKTRVYELARHLNEKTTLIPENTLTKAPSAELRPDQKDQDTLPPYEKLDEVLTDYIENFVPVSELVKKGDWVRDVLRRLELNEYKRRQAAPVLKVSTKAFGIGRRIPIAKVWDQR